MKDLEREAARLLACYEEDERPPPEVDARIRAHLRRETARSDVSHRWLSVGLLVAAAAVLLVCVLGPAVLSRQIDADDSAALHNAAPISPQKTVPPHKSVPPIASPQPETTPEAGDDPGVVILRTARGLMRDGSFKDAYTRLEPCHHTVGTDDLLEECELLVVQALCGAGELVKGRGRLASFRQRWPRSIHARQLSTLCR